MIIDFHVHAIPPEMMNGAGALGPTEVGTEPDGRRVIRIGNQTVRLSPQPQSGSYAQMFLDAQGPAGIDCTGLSISPLFYMYWTPPEVGVPFARRVNDILSGYCSEHPDRLFFLGTLPMQDVEASVAEAERAVSTLTAKALVIGTDNLGGRDLDNEAFFPLYEAVERLGVPLFVHPGPANIEQQVPGRRDKYGSAWMPGYQIRETTAVCHLIYGGVLDAFPDLQVCVSHGGGAAPFLLGKLSRHARNTLQTGETEPIKAQLPFEDYLQRNFYFDTFVEDSNSLRLLLDVMGPDRLLFGQHTGLSTTSSDDLSRIRGTGLADEEVQKIVGGNAAKLFQLWSQRLPHPCPTKREDDE